MLKKLAIASVFLASLMVVGFGSYTWAIKEFPIPSDIGAISTKTAPLVTLPKAPEPTTGKIPFPQRTRITGRTVHISANGSLGSGAIVGNRILITVAHVVKKQRIVLVDVGKYTRKWAPAVVVGHIHAIPENIVILQILTSDRFIVDEGFSIGTGIKIPLIMVTPKGVFPWNPGSVVPGDSGSAVLNIDGELIGLVHGYTVLGKQPVVTLFR